ncbi:MAG: hypothetical protein M1820_008586 [Bogoriella megaspora]|nr:MAG: hypothetical protein M1820_008586 [Bogoriella megaspora]
MSSSQSHGSGSSSATPSNYWQEQLQNHCKAARLREPVWNILSDRRAVPSTFILASYQLRYRLTPETTIIKPATPFAASSRDFEHGVRSIFGPKDKLIADPRPLSLETCRSLHNFYSVISSSSKVVSLTNVHTGGRTAWSSTVLVEGQYIPARYWYDGQYLHNAKEDAAEVALQRLRGQQAYRQQQQPQPLGGQSSPVQNGNTGFGPVGQQTSLSGGTVSPSGQGRGGWAWRGS